MRVTSSDRYFAIDGHRLYTYTRIRKKKTNSVSVTSIENACDAVHPDRCSAREIASPLFFFFFPPVHSDRRSHRGKTSIRFSSARRTDVRRRSAAGRDDTPPRPAGEPFLFRTRGPDDRRAGPHAAVARNPPRPVGRARPGRGPVVDERPLRFSRRANAGAFTRDHVVPRARFVIVSPAGTGGKTLDSAL